ncbi:MAG: tetratricopeptide repeat protein [Planctomycetes bacterium]|nr:tetratricopeptide repeat protein [Planctomycetota bacterium]
MALGSHLPATDAEQAYLFAHTLLRDAAYQLHLPQRRAQLHAKAFAIIESRAQLAGEAALDAAARELAEHATAALTQGRQSRSRRLALQQAQYAYLGRAAKAAMARYRHEEALTLYSRLAELQITPPHERADALRSAGGLCVQATRFSDAERLLAAAEAQWRALGDARGLARCRHSQAKLFGELLRTDDAMAAYAEAFEFAQAAGATALMLEVHCARAVWLRDIGRPLPNDVALAQKLAQDTDSLDARIDALHLQATRAQDEGAIETAHQIWNEALKLAEQTGNPMRVARILGSLGGNLFHSGKPAQAKDAFQRSLAVYRSTGIHFNVPLMLGNLATIAQREGRLHEAEQCYREALELSQEYGLRKTLATLYSNLAAVHQYLGEERQAEQEYRAAMASAKAANDVTALGISAANLGGICQGLGRSSEALALYEEALGLLGEAALLPRSSALAGLAQVLMSLGRLDEAESHTLQARKIAGAAGVPILEAMALGNQAHLALLRGNANESAKLAAQAVAMLDAGGAAEAAQHTVMITQLRALLELEGPSDSAYNVKREILRRAPKGMPQSSVYWKAVKQAEALWQAARGKQLVRGHIASELTPQQRQAMGIDGGEGRQGPLPMSHGGR